MAVVVVSEKPWGDYTKADYTLEQWHAACLIHQHDGAPTSMSQCKLPVKTPTGTLNRNGVHAAAAALAGARGGVDASPEEKAAAAKALVRYYGQLGDQPPPSIKHNNLTDFLAHHGIRGMRWGVRRKSTSGSDSGSGKSDSGKSGSDSSKGESGSSKGKSGSSKKSESDSESSTDGHMSADAEHFIKTHQKQGHEMSDRDIKQAVNRANMVKQYDEIFTPSPNKELRSKVESLQLQKQYRDLNSQLHPGAMARVKQFLRIAGKAYSAFQLLDEGTGGALSGQFKNTFGTATGTSKPTGFGTSGTAGTSNPFGTRTGPMGPIWVQSGPSRRTNPTPIRVIQGQVIRKAIEA